jgi:hypothetical protein
MKTGECVLSLLLRFSSATLFKPLKMEVAGCSEKLKCNQ